MNHKPIHFSIIVAADQAGGIGANGSVPWNLPEDLGYFRRVTTQTADPTKRNCVIMGRKTYFGIPEKYRPLAERLNVVLTRSSLDPSTPVVVLARSSLEHAIIDAATDPSVETIFVIGGGEVYRQALALDSAVAMCDRIYYTHVLTTFPTCDCFIPTLDHLLKNGYRKSAFVHPAAKPGIRERDGVQYEYVVLEPIVQSQ